MLPGRSQALQDEALTDKHDGGVHDGAPLAADAVSDEADGQLAEDDTGHLQGQGRGEMRGDVMMAEGCSRGENCAACSRLKKGGGGAGALRAHLGVGQGVGQLCGADLVGLEAPAGVGGRWGRPREWARGGLLYRI